MFSVPRDPDASRVNGSALVALADAAMAGTRPPFTFSRSDLNDLCLAEPPTFAPVRPPSQSELDEHSKKAMESGKAVLNSQSAWEALFAKIVSPFSSVADFHAAYKSGVSPTDIAERVIKAIEASNATVPPLRAVVQSDPEDIRRQASESASRWKGGKQLGPLDGIFVSIKENFAVKGYEARQGTSFLCRGKPSDYDADLVARLREQGAIVIGMTNMHELGWDISGINPFSGPSRNPYNLHRTAGGSSGGSAASVASGLVPISLGGDAGGSVRIPSAYCGLYGLKPTCGRLSLGPDGGSLSMATKGIHSATVGDLAVAYLAIAGRSPTDPLTATAPVPHVHGLLHPKPLRLGFPEEVWDMCPHPEIRSLCMQALDLLSSQRHAKAPITIPEYVSIRRGQATAAISEMSAGVSNLPPPPGSKSAWEGLSPQLRYELRSWRDTFSAADYLQALRMRTRGMKIFASVFEKCDVLVTPTTGNVGYPIHEGDEISGASAPQSSMEGLLFTGPYNFLGLPAITLPIGYLRGSKDESERGMPVGLQIVAPWWGEDILFGLAREWEKMAEMERPAVFWDVVGDVSSKA